MVFPFNPFQEGGDGSSLPGSWFTGFSDLSHALQCALETNARPVLITGPRQSGKSTLTDTLRVREDLTVVRVDLRYLPDEVQRGDAPSRDAIASLIAETLSYELLPSVSTDVTLDQLLGEILPAVRTGKTLVILVDELDALPTGADQHAFMDAVRASYGGTGTAVRWVIIRGENWGSPSCRFPGVQEIRTRPFVLEEVRAILACHVAHGLYAFDPSVAERILEATGGYPLFVRSILSIVFEGRKRMEDRQAAESVVRAEEAEEAIGKVTTERLQTVRHACAMTWPAAVRLLRVVVAADKPLARDELGARFHEEWPRWDEAFSETLGALCRVSLVREMPDGFRLAVPLLAQIMASDAHNWTFNLGHYPSFRAFHYVRRGEAAMREGRGDDAIADFRTALAASPSPRWLFEALVRFPTAERLAEAERHLAWMHADPCTVEQIDGDRQLARLRGLLDNAKQRSLSP